MGLEDFNGVFLYGLCFWEALAIVEVNEVSRSVVLSSLSAFGAVSGKVSYFSALEAGVRGVSCGSRVALEVILWTVPLVLVGVLSSAEVIASVVSSVIPLSRHPIPVYIHRNWGVIHPSRGV